MEFSIKATSPERTKTACLVVPVFAGGDLGPQAQAVADASGGELLRLAKRDLDDKAGALLALPLLPGVSAEREPGGAEELAVGPILSGNRLRGKLP